MTMTFFAAANQKEGMVPKRIRTDQQLQSELTGLFEAQATEFLSADLDRVPFDGRYKVDESELFIISGFKMSDEYLAAAKQPQQCDDLILKQTTPVAIRSLFAARHDVASDSTTIYFQSFNRSRLLIGGFTVLLQQNTYQKITDAGLTFDTKLAAVYQDGDLLFRSYSAVKSFLDVTEYFHEATNEEISAVLRSTVMSCPDEATVLQQADGWMRKRFSAIKASRILEKITARKVVNRAKKFGLAIQVSKMDGKSVLVFPVDKKEAKKFLSFLSEGYFVGELTGALYQSNSQIRIVGTPSVGESH